MANGCRSSPGIARAVDVYAMKRYAHLEWDVTMRATLLQAEQILAVSLNDGVTRKGSGVFLGNHSCIERNKKGQLLSGVFHERLGPQGLEASDSCDPRLPVRRAEVSLAVHAGSRRDEFVIEECFLNLPLSVSGYGTTTRTTERMRILTISSSMRPASGTTFCLRRHPTGDT